MWYYHYYIKKTRAEGEKLPVLCLVYVSSLTFIIKLGIIILNRVGE